MPNLTVEMTDGELFALSLVAVNTQEWADNALTARANAVLQEYKQKPQWAQAAVALATSGGDVADEWAVLMKGGELGLFKTAAQSKAEQAAAIQTEVALPTSDTVSIEAVEQQRVLLVMAVTQTSSRAEMDASITNGMMDGMAILQAKASRELTAEEIARETELNAFHAALRAIKSASDAIKADVTAGTITTLDQVKTDARWPSFPSA